MALARDESSHLARDFDDFLDEVLHANGIDPSGLVIHSDQGVPMTAQPLAELCFVLGMRKSLSRPRTSNDKALSASRF